MTEKHFVADPNPWIPMSDLNDVRVIGKLGEELNECASAASRCLIQGIDEAEPSTGKLNRVWLEDEIADVLVNLKLVCERFDLKPSPERMALKETYLRKWHEMD